MATLQKNSPKGSAGGHGMNGDALGLVETKGLVGAIELVQDRDSKKPYPLQNKIGQRVILEARHRGVIIRPLGDVIVLMPPLSITPRELETLADVVYESIQTVTEK